MSEDTRTTQYLFEFAASGQEKTQQAFEAMMSKLDAYEQQLREKMGKIDALLAGGGQLNLPQAPVVLPQIDPASLQQAQQAIAQSQQAQQAIAQSQQQAMALTAAAPSVPVGAGEELLYQAEAWRDNILVMTEYRKKLDDSVGTIERSRSTYNNFGREIENLTERTWTAADGVKNLQRSVTTDIEPGVPKQLTSFTQLEVGKQEIEETVTAMNDLENTVVKTRRVFDVATGGIKEFTTTTKTLESGLRSTETSIDTIASGVPKVTSSFTEWRDGVQRVEEVTTALNDQQNTIVKTKETWDAQGASMGKQTTTMRTLADGTKETKVEVEGLTQAMRGGATYSEQFIRHLRWISQGIVLWAGINAVSNALKDWWSVQSQLNQSLAEFEMRTGATQDELDQYREGILAASRAAAIAPSELAPVAPVAPDDTTLRYAAELQRVAGGDLQNQMQWLIAQQRQFGYEGQNTVEILDAMASGWRLTTLPMSQFITMLRDAAPLSEEFNLTMEEMYSMFGALQAVTGAEGRELDYLVRNLSRLYEPQVQQDLGIQTTRVLPTGDVERRNIIAVLDEVNQKIKEGEVTVEEFAALFGATGRGQRQQIQRVMLAWDSFIGAMGRSMDTPAQWSNMFDTAMDTPIAKTDALKASWQRLLLSISDTTAFLQAIESLTAGIDLIDSLITGKVDEWADVWELDINIAPALAGLPAQILSAQANVLRTAQNMGKSIGDAIGEAMTISLPPWLMRIDQAIQNSAIGRWIMGLAGNLPEIETGGVGFTRREEVGARMPTYEERAAAGGWPTQAPPQAQPITPYTPGGREPFEGVRELPQWPSQVVVPEDVDFSDVVRSMNEWVAAFSSLGPEFENWVNANMEMVMVYDENTRHLQMMNVFLPALQRAITENTQAQKARELQPGLRNVELDLSSQGGMLRQWVAYYTQFLTRMGYPQEAQPQLVLGINDTFLRLWASNEALMLAIRALTEATEDQTDILSGMWNVPEGTTMWVPIQSLFYSRRQEQPGIGGIPELPPALPAQQPDWMTLPGAVDQMSVSNMTVTNLKGLTVTVPEQGEDGFSRFLEAWRAENQFGWPASEPDLPMTRQPAWVGPLEAALMRWQQAEVEPPEVSVEMPTIEIPPIVMPQVEMPPIEMPTIESSLRMDTLSVDSIAVTQMDVQSTNERGVTQPETPEQTRILSDILSTLREEAAARGEEAPQLDVNRISQALSSAITSFRERAGGVGAPEPQWSGMDLSQLISQISIVPSEIKASTLEIQSPQTDMISPMVRSTSVSTDIMTPTTSMMTSVANIMAGSLTGLPSFDTSGIERGIATMQITLQLILTTLQTQKPVYIPIPVGGPTITSAASVTPTPDDVRRFNQESNYWSFTNYSRMRSAF